MNTMPPPLMPGARPRSASCSWLVGLALALLAGGGRSVLPAQPDPELIAKANKAFEVAMEQAVKRAFGDTLHVSSTIALVDPATRTVTLALTNVGADTVVVDTIRMQDAAPPARRSTSADPLLAPDSGAAGASPKEPSPADSLPSVGSLAAWVQDVPKPFAVAPGATQTLSLHLAVPPSLAPGAYAAYLVLHTTPIVVATPSVCWMSCRVPLSRKAMDKTGRYPFVAARIVYRAGAAPAGPASKGSRER